MTTKGGIICNEPDSDPPKIKESSIEPSILFNENREAGFFLIQYAHLWQEHLDRLVNLFSSGKLKIAIDPKQFVGLHSVADAVEYLHSGKSAGKVVVCIDPTYVQQLAKL
ncbi:hypothetical protein HAX54_000376 [Datura stramonium]|uniref:Uncharacterized protein n=1 Tax=Datura stramonium TaxID=4076 RepID=A0ABS8RRW6_DATST|nr:hypothetical protein [Datura stramonium]